MPENKERLLEQLNISSKDRSGLRQIVPTLSLLVVLMVFWSLKLTGIGVAGEAFCGIPEHTHGEECFRKTLVCTLEETAGETQVTGETQATGETQTTENTEVGHTHTDECYEVTAICELDEHIHIESCYSNVHADLETSDDWEATLADMVRGPTTRENVILVAQSQLDYTESELNFQVDAGGVRRGITRYGQWYGNPYGDWSAMFVSFCLEYAGASDLPMNAGPESMRIEWEAAEIYQTAEEAAPERGNLIFLCKGEPELQNANAVAIITGVDETTITVIEGDLENTVAETQYALDDPAIMGYGILPQEDPIMVLAPGDQGAKCTVWLDGTNGGMTPLTGSPNTAISTNVGSVIQLPETWTSPSKYSYKLRGWYDITNSQYYLPGAEMTVTGNAVLYADWVASTYDIGQFNAQVADTVSTSSFITTYMFDYNYLFNIHSSKAQITVNDRSHSETWSMVTSGNVAHGNAQTLNFVFVENDNSGGKLAMPNNRNSNNTYPGEGIVTPGIYTSQLGNLLFDTNNQFDPATGEGVLGKTYLGTGDHLFQIMDDPNDEHYGYYYYDSKRNAASYNQSNGRFYVYEYLEATSDSIGGAYSDFLPLNSPYANTNGKNVGRYTYNGTSGEYNGVSHYRYDSKYNSGDHNSTNNVITDYAYGMRTDIRFYLPNDPGTGGNKDMYGNDMQFQFSGDDDLWVLIDGKLVLDIGGIHGAEQGVIDFSTGEVTVQGKGQTSLMDLGITAGDHTMSILYLERGSSMSNCSIYFNMAPRFGLELKKEDVLTQEVLNGAQFSVYKDLACTEPAQLWESESAYNADLADGTLDQATNTFTVRNGKAVFWGLGSGNTYYIKETAAPNKEGYGITSGVIRLKIEREGQATYLVDVIKDAEGNDISNGYTVHGVTIDEQTQTVYLVVTNAPETVTEITTVQVLKKWEDTADHSGDYIQAYLTVTDPDGTVRRIREITLSDENGWNYIWTNLPKYDYEAMTEVQYGIEESYESGYYSTVRRITQIEINSTAWAESLTFQNGQTYILRTSSGYLSTINNNADTGYKWVNEQTAKSSPNALWTATVTNNKVKFTNGVGQTITFYYNNGSPTDFYARIGSPGTNDRQEYGYSNRNGGIQIFYQQGNTKYYMTSSMNSSGKFGYNTNQNQSMIFTPVCRVTQSDVRPVEDWAYQITNIPLAANNETSFAVRKAWDIPEGYDETFYQEFAVTVRLLANGVNTGRTITLNLKNNWRGTFQGLPYQDDNGNVIVYTVQEVWEQARWHSTYGPIQTIDGKVPTYSTVITNTYLLGGPLLPSTGSAARYAYVLCGWAIILGTLVYGIGSRRKRERRMK